MIVTEQAPGDNYGYAQTVLRAMQILTVKGAQDARVQRIAAALKGPTDIQTLRNDFAFLQRRIPFVDDPPDMERIHSARYTVGEGVGEDCDGLSVAAATVFALQGIPAQFRAIAWRNPNFTHVYTVANVEGAAVPFDLTLPALGNERTYTNHLDAPTMPQIQSISDTPHQTEVLVNALVNGNHAERRAAFGLLEQRFPAQMTTWITRTARDVSATGTRGFRDPFGDWVSSLLGTVASAATSILPGGGILSAATQSFLPTDTSTKAPADADPNRPGRSVHDARTYMDELINPSAPIYPSKIKPKTTVSTDDHNFAVILYVPTFPALDQSISSQYPGHLFLSWDGAGTWISDYATCIATPAGNSFQLTLTGGADGPQTLPGYYARTTYTDGAVRYDNIGTTPAQAPPPQTGTAQPSNSTSTRADTGLPPKAPTQNAGSTTSPAPSQPTAPGYTPTAPGAPTVPGAQSAGILGMDTNTMLMVGGALALLMLLKK